MISSLKMYKAQLPLLTMEQKEVLLGMLLGDAHARHKVQCRDASIDFVQSLKQREFLDHLFTLFQDYTWMQAPRIYISKQKHKEKEEEDKMPPRKTMYSFSTFTHPEFTSLHRMFYVLNTFGFRRHKIIPMDVTSWITPRVLAYHVMCDGSMYKRALTLATHGFSEEDCLRYVQEVNKIFNLHGGIRPHRCYGRKYTRICFPVKDFLSLQTLVRPFLLPMFSYKMT